jgi:DNA-binding GntR family transcriptional regulator
VAARDDAPLRHCRIASPAAEVVGSKLFAVDKRSTSYNAPVTQDAIELGASRSDSGDRFPDFENLTLWQRVHRVVSDEILSNRLPPGTVLNEVALARSLGVSRGPVREAIGRLASEGLVHVRPRRGAVVASLTRAEFLEAYQVREALEVMAIRLAVIRIADEAVAELERLTAEMQEYAERGDVDRFFQANAAFHAAIVEASGNQKLREVYRQVVGQMGRYQMRSLALRGTLRRSIQEHRAIVRAMRRRDADRSAHLLSEHIRVPQRRLESASDDELIELRPIEAEK